MELHFTTLYDLAKGHPKSPETMIKFARGIGESPAKWLELAGHEAHIADSTPTGAEHLLAGIGALQQELGRPIPVVFHSGIRAGLTIEEAEQLLATIRQQAVDGMI